MSNENLHIVREGRLASGQTAIPSPGQHFGPLDAAWDMDGGRYTMAEKQIYKVPESRVPPCRGRLLAGMAFLKSRRCVTSRDSVFAAIHESAMALVSEQASDSAALVFTME